MDIATETSPVPVGVVGAGLVAQAVHLPLLRRLERRYRIESLAEPHEPTRHEAARRYGIPDTYADHRALLDAGRVEAVIVCSPDATHAGVVLDALDAGVHVLVEKPMCVTVDDGERIVAARDRTDRVVQVGYMKRFDPAVEALLADLSDARPPRYIATATFDPGLRDAFSPPQPASTPAHRPHALRDAFLGALIHDVNLVHAVLARCGLAVARVVDAFGDPQGAAAGGTIALRGGGRWSCAWLALPEAGTFREHVALYGGDGVRELEFPAPYALHAPTVYRHVRAAGAGSAQTSRTSWQEAYERQLLHFHDCITARAACRNPPQDALADIRLLEQLIRGCATEVPA